MIIPAAVMTVPSHWTMEIVSWNINRAAMICTQRKPRPAVRVKARWREMKRKRKVKANTPKKPERLPTICHQRKPCHPGLAADNLRPLLLTTVKARLARFSPPMVRLLIFCSFGYGAKPITPVSLGTRQIPSKKSTTSRAFSAYSCTSNSSLVIKWPPDNSWERIL